MKSFVSSLCLRSQKALIRRHVSIRYLHLSSDSSSITIQASNQMIPLSGFALLRKLRSKVNMFFIYFRYGQLGIFVSDLLKAEIKLRYSSYKNFGGHICDEFFDYIHREDESKLIVDLFKKCRSLRNEANAIKEEKSRNSLIALTGAPGSGKSAFLIHFPISQAYTEYIKHHDTVLISTMSFNSAMEGGEPAFGLRVLFGFLKAMGLLLPDSANSRWPVFYKHFQKFKDILAEEVIDMICAILEVEHNKLEFLILVDELSKSEAHALVAKLDKEEAKKVIMAQISVLLSNYENVNILVTSLSPNFIEDMFTGSFRPVDYVIPRPLIGSSLGAFACENITRYLLDSVKGTDNCPDPTNVKIMKNLYLLLSGHPRSLEHMSRSMLDHPEEWYSLNQEMCIPNNHSTFLMYALQILDKRAKTVPTVQLKNFEVISKYIFAAEGVESKDDGYRLLLESGYLQIYESDEDEFILMSPSVSVLKWIYSNNKFRFDPYENKKLYQIQKLAVNFENLCLSDMMEYIIAISIISHSYERNKVDSILGVHTLYSTFVKSPEFEVKYEKDITTDNDLILPNHLYMAKANQAGYDMRVVAENKSSNSLRYYYLQVKIRLPDDPIVEITARMIYNNLKHYQSICPGQGLQDLYMYMYIWDTVSIDMIPQQDLLNVFMSLSYQNKEDAITFIANYYDHLIVIDKSRLQKWILPSFVAIPDLIHKVDNIPI